MVVNPIMITLSTLLSKPIATFVVEEPPSIVASQLQQLNKLPFTPNPKALAKSTIIKSTNTNALFHVSLGASSAYIDLYLESDKLHRTSIRLSLSRIQAGTIFLVLLYLVPVSLFILVLMQKSIIIGLLVYIPQVIFVLSIYQNVKRVNNTNLLLLLNGLFPEHIFVKHKPKLFTLFKPTQFEFMSSKSIEQISQLTRTVYQLNIRNDRKVTLRQYMPSPIQHDAVIQIEKGSEGMSYPFVVASVQAYRNHDNDIVVSGQLFEAHKSTIIYILIGIWGFVITIGFASMRIDASLLIGGLLTFTVLAQYKFQSFRQDDINDLTDFIYQTLA